jgi:dTDP-4-dehydrorhamnose 3,5-epimerase
MMIHGVQTKVLQAHCDERGYLMEILRCDDTIFAGFGQAYVALNYPGIIRAWHWHERQEDVWAVVRGMVKAVLIDRRRDSPTFGEVEQFFLGEENRIALRIPAGVLHGYKTIGVEPSLLLNFPSRPYDPEDPDERRLPYDSPEVPYQWGIWMR